eukprot:GHUV01049456.1.p1 GENE.GHUV01049456.1~~GHUV01049456.1.p1  ORF type:complete len:171 (+),score=57.30 GHUV01049456.1:83-595(+)
MLLLQTARHTKLEQSKHCLVLLKKACRAATATSWKQLRSRMEQELTERLAVQQKDMDEQLSFVQGKLRKAQQQRDYAKAFHADVLRKLAAEESVQQEAAAARSRLASLRNRLSELKGLNTDRQARAGELLALVKSLKVWRSVVCLCGLCTFAPPLLCTVFCFCTAHGASL